MRNEHGHSRIDLNNKALMTATVVVIFKHFYNRASTFDLDTISLRLECPKQD